jgi:hypothetical protein
LNGGQQPLRELRLLTALGKKCSISIPTGLPAVTSSAQSPCLGGCAAETRSDAEFLSAIQVDVIDARFAGFNTIHYLLKVLVFDL